MSRSALVLIGVIALSHSVSAQETQHARRRIELNGAAFEYALHLIEHGEFMADKRDEWQEHKPSSEQASDFIRQHGYDKYGYWFLGIDESHSKHSKARYKFPFGDFVKIHRCGLLAVQNRARQFDYGEIAEAAAKLQAAMEAKQQSSRPSPSETRR